MLFLMSHWLAGLWGFVGTQVAGSSADDHDNGAGVPRTWIEHARLSEAGMYDIYGATLYTALSNIVGSSSPFGVWNSAEYYVQVPL